MTIFITKYEKTNVHNATKDSEGSCFMASKNSTSVSDFILNLLFHALMIEDPYLYI